MEVISLKDLNIILVLAPAEVEEGLTRAVLAPEEVGG
jgi:hypothetical protein